MERNTSNAIRDRFGRDRVFLPVIHPAQGMFVAIEAIEIAVRSGADGVFLINQGMQKPHVLQLAETARSQYPDLWIGMNLLGLEPAEVLSLAPWIDGIWSDDAGFDNPIQNLAYADELAAARSKLGWSGLWFGGVAFKTQRDIPSERWAEVASASAPHMDVVTTSGRGTGVEVDPAKTAAFHAALGDKPLGLASGVTIENVHKVLPDVNAFLIGTGIEARDEAGRPMRGVLVEQTVRQLADRIHAFGKP